LNRGPVDRCAKPNPEREGARQGGGPSQSDGNLQTKASAPKSFECDKLLRGKREVSKKTRQEKNPFSEDAFPGIGRANETPAGGSIRQNPEGWKSKRDSQEVVSQGKKKESYYVRRRKKKHYGVFAENKNTQETVLPEQSNQGGKTGLREKEKKS